MTVLEHLWYYAYLIRNKLAEEARGDYVFALQSQGMPARRILAALHEEYLPTLGGDDGVASRNPLRHIHRGNRIRFIRDSASSALKSAMYQDYNLLTALCLLTGAVVFLSVLAQVLGEALDPHESRGERRSCGCVSAHACRSGQKAARDRPASSAAGRAAEGCSKTAAPQKFPRAALVLLFADCGRPLPAAT